MGKGSDSGFWHFYHWVAWVRSGFWGMACSLQLVSGRNGLTGHGYTQRSRRVHGCCFYHHHQRIPKLGWGKGQIRTVCLSYVFAVRLGTNVTWNQSNVIVAFKRLVSINYCSFDYVWLVQQPLPSIFIAIHLLLHCGHFTSHVLLVVFCYFSRTNFAPVSNQRGYLYKLKSIGKAKKRISFLRW